MICYAIKDWEKHFENSESRKIKSLTWVPVKNKHDGKGYRRVVAHSKSIQVFCAWNLIVQVASKMPVRGILRDEDGPLTTSDLSVKTGYPEHIFETAFQLLSDQKIGWLVQIPHQQPDGEQNSANLPMPPETSGDAGIEQNGREQNRTEGNLNPPLEGGVGGEHRTTNIEQPTSDGCGLQTRAEEAERDSVSRSSVSTEDSPEIPDEDQAVTMTMNAGIDEKFVRYVYRSWANQNGKNANGIVVPWLRFVTNRWKNEQEEWKNGTHRGNRKSNHANTRTNNPDRNAGTYNAPTGKYEKHVGRGIY